MNNIYSFTPYSTSKNFGKAINDCCEIVPNPDDWICIRDGDVMNLTPNWGYIIEDAIRDYGHEYKLFGCWTNRLNPNEGSGQLLGGMYNETDIYKHFLEAMEQEVDGSNIIVPITKIAGFFMLFQKKTWIEVGGFQENYVAFDHDFCARVRAKKGKIGLINRLYMLHLYRIWAKNKPWNETKHLK